MFKKLLLLLSGNIFSMVMLFLRTIIVARLISVEDFGIAATFTISVAIIQVASTLGLEKMIIQDNNGEDPRFQMGLQGFQLMRGVTSALALFLLSWPMARFLGNEDLVWAYQLMALIPLLGGLGHLDLHRMQRNMSYIPMTLYNTVPALGSLLLLWPLNRMFGDYRVMLYSILAQWMLRLVVSHAVAKRRYAVVFDRGILRQGMIFGFPLLIDGLLLFAVFQGEKMIVGRELGMATLGIFSMGITLLQTPSGSVSASLTTFLLPQLSATKSDDTRFNTLSLVSLQAYFLSAIGLCLGILIFGQIVVQAALGAKYAAVVPLLIWLSITQALRTAKNGTALISLARAKTENGPVGNVPRVLAILVSWYALTLGFGLPTVLAIAILGELGGLVLTLWLTRVRAGVPIRPMLPSLSAFLLFLLTIGAYGAVTQTGLSASVPIAVPIAAILGSCVLALLSMGALIKYIRAREMATYE